MANRPEQNEEALASDSFGEAVAEYFSSVDREGSVSLSRLLGAFPQHREELLKFFESEQQLAEHWQALPTEVSRNPSDQTFSQPIQIGRFQIERRLGSGAFGVVYLAHDDALKRLVALKIPLPQLIGDEESRRRFEAEAAAAARLHHHGIVAVYEADFAGPVPYIASAYCPGPDLGHWLERHQEPIPWRDAARLMAELADAVHYAHQAEIYHRDIKPSNVLLNPGEKKGDGASLQDFSPQLTDFGLAKCALFNDRQTRSSMVLGTPLYMAPEQLESARSEWPIQSDLYSLGCMLYELITRRLPISGETYAVVLDQLRTVEPTAIKQLVPEVPSEIERVCHKCLEKNPQARYQSAAEFAHDLRACLDGQPIQATKPSFMVRFRYWLTRPQRVFDAGLFTVCVQLLLTVWLTMAIAIALGTHLVDADAGPRLIAEAIGIVGLVHMPMALVGWQTIRRKRWAVAAGLVLSAINLIVPIVFVSLSLPPFLADIYAKVDASNYTAFTTCGLMLLAELGQLFLYVAAYAAQRHAERLRC